MLIHEMRSGEKVFLRDDAIIVRFPGPRRVVSTARINGGHREDLQAVFNHHIPADCKAGELPGGSAEGYLGYLMEKLGLPRDRTAGLLTAARMENAAIKALSFRELEVTAIVTAGVDVNGGRAGDPAWHYELDGKWTCLGGTINTFLFVDGNLPPHTLVRAIVTATEAKAAALQELMAPSRYSRGIATGSGTDQIIAVSNAESLHRFSCAGKHSKLGELIGRVVKEATKEALEKETGLNPKRQRNFLARLERYGIGPEDFWREAQEAGLAFEKGRYFEQLHRLAGDARLVALVASLLHLLDEYEWGLLPAEVVVEEGGKYLRSSLPWAFPGRREKDAAASLLGAFVSGVNKLIKNAGAAAPA